MSNNEDNDKWFNRIIISCMIFAVLSFIGLFFTVDCHADQATINVDNENVTLTEVCLNGRLFLTTTSGTGRFHVRGVSTIQVMHQMRRRSILLPVLCTVIQGSSNQFTITSE